MKTEIAENRAKAKAERLAMKSKFPSARVDKIFENCGAVLSFENGDPSWLEVRWRSSKGGSWTAVYISISDDSMAVSEFLAAFCARYNYAMEQLNVKAAGIKAVKAIEPK